MSGSFGLLDVVLQLFGLRYPTVEVACGIATELAKFCLCTVLLVCDHMMITHNVSVPSQTLVLSALLQVKPAKHYLVRLLRPHVQMLGICRPLHNQRGHQPAPLPQVQRTSRKHWQIGRAYTPTLSIIVHVRESDGRNLEGDVMVTVPLPYSYSARPLPTPIPDAHHSHVLTTSPPDSITPHFCISRPR